MSADSWIRPSWKGRRGKQRLTAEQSTLRLLHTWRYGGGTQLSTGPLPRFRVMRDVSLAQRKEYLFLEILPRTRSQLAPVVRPQPELYAFIRCDKARRHFLFAEQHSGGRWLALGEPYAAELFARPVKRRCRLGGGGGGPRSRSRNSRSEKAAKAHGRSSRVVQRARSSSDHTLLLRPTKRRVFRASTPSDDHPGDLGADAKGAHVAVAGAAANRVRCSSR